MDSLMPWLYILCLLPSGQLFFLDAFPLTFNFAMDSIVFYQPTPVAVPDYWNGKISNAWDDAVSDDLDMPSLSKLFGPPLLKENPENCDMGRQIDADSGCSAVGSSRGQSVWIRWNVKSFCLTMRLAPIIVSDDGHCSIDSANDLDEIEPGPSSVTSHSDNTKSTGTGYNSDKLKSSCDKNIKSTTCG